MIESGYLTPKAPPALKRNFDQNVIPALIDATGSLEAIVERWATRVRRAPVQSTAIVFGACALASILLRRRRL